MSDEQETVSAEDAVTVALRAEQVRIEDECVTLAQANGWCDEIGSALHRLFPNGPSWPNTENKWTVSTTGRDCHGHTPRDAEGRNRLGFDRDGYDRNGYDFEGRDREGFDRDGMDSNGVHRSDPARFRFNSAGIDAEGFNTSDYDRYGHRRGERPAELDRYVYDRNGWNIDGYNSSGFNREGYNAEGRDVHGFDRDGYDANGRDRRGRTREGIDEMGRRRGPDGTMRVAHVTVWRREYLGRSEGDPAEYGTPPETAEQAAEAAAWWAAKTRDERRR